MKRFLLVLLSIFIFSTYSNAGIFTRFFTSLTGEVAGSVDNIDCDDVYGDGSPTDDGTGYVITSTGARYFYFFDQSATNATSSPDYIRCKDAPYTSGVWIRQSLPADEENTHVTNTDSHDHSGGDGAQIDHGGLAGLTDDDHTQYLKEADFDAQTVLHATSDDTPVALTVTEQTVVGRVTGGNIAAVAIDSDISSVSASDDTVPSALATKTYIDDNIGGVTSGDLATTSPIAGAVDNIFPGTGTKATISIADAAADDSTKGAATFEADDFISSSGKIDIDYANGQKATTDLPGFLTDTDWDTFNGKQDSGATLTSLEGLTIANGSILYGTAADTLAVLAHDTGKYLMSNGAGAPSWETLAGGGDVTGVDAGDGIRVDDPDTATPDVHIDFQENTTDLEGTAIATADVLLYMDSDNSDDMARGLVSDLPFHTQSHAMTSTSDHTAGNWKFFYSNGSGEIIELTMGADGEYIMSNGAALAPSFETPVGAGDVTGITAGDGIRVDNPDTATPDVHIDYDENTTNLESTAVATADIILYMDSDNSDDMARGLVSDLPFESDASNNIDPDRIAGDTVDDNLLDAAAIHGDIARDSELHTRSHAMTSTSDHTASNWSVFYSNGSGEVVELALANSGVLTANGVSSAPTFEAAGTGDMNDVGDDTTPQLGGHLDTNEKKIFNGAVPSTDADAGDVVVVLADNAGSNAFVVEDVDEVSVFEIDSDGRMNPGDTPQFVGHHDTADEDVFKFGMINKAATESDTILQGFTGNTLSTFFTHDGGTDEINTTKVIDSSAAIEASSINAGILVQIITATNVVMDECREAFYTSANATVNIEYDLPASGLCSAGSGNEYDIFNGDPLPSYVHPDGTDIIIVAGEGSCGAGGRVQCDQYEGLHIIGRDAGVWFVLTGNCACEP